MLLTILRKRKRDLKLGTEQIARQASIDREVDLHGKKSEDGKKRVGVREGGIGMQIAVSVVRSWASIYAGEEGRWG